MLIRKGETWISAGRFLTLVAGIVSIRIITEIVSPQEYGRLSLVMGLISFFSLILYTSLGRSATRYIWDYINQDKGAVWVWNVIFATFGLGFIFTILLWSALAFGIDIKLDPLVAIWTIPVFLIAGSLATILLGIFNILQEHRIFVLGMVINAWLKPGLAIFFALLFLPTAEMILVGYASSALLLMLGVLWAANKRSLLQFVPHKLAIIPTLTKMGIYTIPFIFVNLFYWTQITSNRFILDANLGIEQVGVFVVAATVGRLPIQSLESIFGQVHQPRLYKKIGQQSDKAVDVQIRRLAFSEYILSFLIITLPILGLTIITGDILIRLFAAESYWIGVKVIPWIATAEFLRALTAVFSIAFEIEKRPRSLVFPIVIGSLVTLGLTYFLSLKFGIVGAGIALTVGTLVWLLFISIPASQLSCWSIPWPELLKATFSSVIIGTIIHLTRVFTSNLGFPVEIISLGVVFIIVYLLYSGKRLLDIRE